MTFILLAIEHTWQMAHVWHASEREPNQLLEKMLTPLMGKIGCICEESDPCRLSVAQKMAYNHRPRIPWKNIAMSAQERLEADIYDPLFYRPTHAIEDPPGSGVYRTVYPRIAEDDIREQFFSRECIRAAQANRASTALVLCGESHVDALKEKLEANGHQAVVNRGLVHRHACV